MTYNKVWLPILNAKFSFNLPGTGCSGYKCRINYETLSAKQPNYDHRVVIMFFLSWSLNDNRSNMRIVWKYVRKTRRFDKN